MVTLEKREVFLKKEEQTLARGDGLFKVLEKVNNNAYKLELPGDMGVSPTFNVRDLTPYLEDEEDGADLRANNIQEGEHEANVMLTQVQVSSQILFNAHKLHQKGLSPCTDLEFQIQPYLKPFGCITLVFLEG